MSTRDFLVELGTEELPPKALKKLSEAFTAGIIEGFEKAGLQYGAVHGYAAPRRLAVWVEALVTAQPDKATERRGPALQAAFGPDGPTKAALGFATSCGVTMDQLARLETDRGSWLIYRGMEQGKPTQELIPSIVQQSLDNLPIPKRMRWGDLTAEFVRPVHWLVLLFGNEVIDAEILAVKSGRETRGHRFHHPEKLYIGEPAAYAPLLETEGRVVASFADRREAIRGQVQEAAVKLGGVAVIDEELLDEVTGMIEWPMAVAGSFEERFLAVPAEALISAMKGHQKYFHAVDKHGKLMPNFITVSNIESKDVAAVRGGNERVIRPRLSDAEFFWNQDRKLSLEQRLESLKSVVFQQKLGTVYDKVQRVMGLAFNCAMQIGCDDSAASLAKRAAELSKCDLMAAMVGEFPELQGIMGRYYARHDNEPQEVAIALDEQYMPRFAGDRVPRTSAGQALAIADRLDTLVGIFGIGQLPTGDKDPFGLRRAALGVLRTIIENRLEQFDLYSILGLVRNQHGFADKKQLQDQTYDFMMDRLRAYYAEQGITTIVFDAVLAVKPTRPYDFDQRVRAVNTFRSLSEAESLVAANKRASNILRQADEHGIKVGDRVDAALLQDAAEKALAERINSVAAAVKPALEQFDYTTALQQMAALREPVDAFFDQVMVMVWRCSINCATSSCRLLMYRSCRVKP